MGTVGGYLYTRIRSDVITKSKGSQELANSSEDEEDGIPSGIVQDEDYYLNQLKRKEDPESSKSSSVRRNRAYFTRGEKAKINADNTDIVVSQSKKPKLRDYEELFRKFKHSEAMGKALRTNDPSVVSTVLEELNRRDALNSTISSIDEEELVQLLSFLRKNITNPLHSKTLIPIANLLLGNSTTPRKKFPSFFRSLTLFFFFKKTLDAHTDHLDASPDILRQLHFLRESVSSEIATQMDLHRMKGNMDMILAAALLSSNQ